MSTMSTNRDKCINLSPGNIPGEVNSLYNKMTELMVLSETHDVQIICVTESWLNSDIVDAEVSMGIFQNYRMLRCDNFTHFSEKCPRKQVHYWLNYVSKAFHTYDLHICQRK